MYGFQDLRALKQAQVCFEDADMQRSNSTQIQALRRLPASEDRPVSSWTPWRGAVPAGRLGLEGSSLILGGALPQPLPSTGFYEHPLGHMTSCSPVKLALRRPGEAIVLLANADRFKQAQSLLSPKGKHWYVRIQNALCHSRLHSCLWLSWPGKTPWSFLVLLLLFSCRYPRGCALWPLDCGPRPGGETGPTMDSCVVVGKAACISELCFLISKTTIAVFVLLTQSGGAYMHTVCERARAVRKNDFFWIVLDLKICSNYETAVNKWNSFKIDEGKLTATNFQSCSPEISRVFHAAHLGNHTHILVFNTSFSEWNHQAMALHLAFLFMVS